MVVLFSGAAMEVNMKDVGIVFEKVACAITKMRIYIHYEETLYAHFSQTLYGDRHIIEIAKSPAASSRGMMSGGPSISEG